MAEAQNLMVGVVGWKSLQEWTSLQIGNRDHPRLTVEERQEQKEVGVVEEEGWKGFVNRPRPYADPFVAADVAVCGARGCEEDADADEEEEVCWSGWG